MEMLTRRVLLMFGFGAVLAAGLVATQTPATRPNDADPSIAERPFGTLREQAAMQQEWLRKRLDTFLPALMRKHGIDLWVVPMREYAEDPVFSAIAAPETFAARRRTIYVFFDTCASRRTAPPAARASKRIALGGTSQGGVFEARRSTRPADSNVGRGQQAELWGDEQWQVLKSVIEERKPARHRHQPIDRVRLLGRAVQRRAEGHDRRARRHVDVALQ